MLLLRLNITLESMVLFSEDHIQETKRRGRIEVICGSMFSGKTEELIRRLKRAKFAKQRVEIFKPAIDTRYSEADVVSHDRFPFGRLGWLADSTPGIEVRTLRFPPAVLVCRS